MDVMDGDGRPARPGLRVRGGRARRDGRPSDDAEMREALLGSALTVPDGMPLVWAANMLGDEPPHRVYGPELMLRYSQRSAERGHRVWLYGGRDQGSLAQLALNLRQRHPGHPDRRRLLAARSGR